MNILLLRGLMRDVRHWGSFLTDLEAVTKVNRAVGLDLPGVGTEEHRIFYPRLKEVVQDVRSRFKRQEQDRLHEDWAILGFSLGGMIALEWANTYPEDFKKIILMNTSSNNTGKLWQRMKPESMLSVVKIFIEPDARKRETEVIQMVSNLKKSDKTLIEEWVGIAKKSSFSRVTAVNQLVAAAQFKLPSRVQSKTLVLTSRADRMVDYKNSLAIAKRLRADLQVHPSAGHDISVDDPEWCVEKISSWI